jgi:hypothetical protein
VLSSKPMGRVGRAGCSISKRGNILRGERVGLSK